ncbi:response regulator [Paenibacillus sp. H1-7]|uniref:response regulator transcription factor n=1 Tax=Paenibacillus sp. H1-7 TaxID=2282849 RepID=UPI001EF871C9|nr:response regulator [Paenibacillus sp. H1-7]
MMGQSGSLPLNVLVVDDELPLREELRSFPWRQHHAELVGEAENGEEALDLCRKLTPDLVITDITMPVMNGLDLFRSIKQEFPYTQVVVLTCHSDFEYAREALKWGALEYLIKVSLLDSDMVQVLDKARLAIARERNHRHNESDRLRWDISKWLTHYSGMEVLDGGIEREDTGPLQQWGVKWPATIVRLCVCVREADELYVQRELQSLLGEWRGTEGFIRHWIPLESMNYLLLAEREESPSRAELLSKVKEFLAKLQEEMERRLSYISDAIRYYALLGPEIDGSDSLLRSAAGTQIPGGVLFYDRSGTVYDIERGFQSGTRDAADKEKLTTSIRKAAASSGQLAQFFRQSFPTWAEQCRPEPEQLKRWILKLRTEWSKPEEEEGGADDAASMHSILLSPTLEELTAHISRELESVPVSQGKCRKEIVLAKQRIADRLAEPITLTQIAEDVGLSSFYFSRLFREEVGESFNEYVTRLRMDKAVHLLKSTTLKVYEVAEQVGIPSYRYFSVLFRNRTGVSPTEYKKG